MFTLSDIFFSIAVPRSSCIFAAGLRRRRRLHPNRQLMVEGIYVANRLLDYLDLEEEERVKKKGCWIAAVVTLNK